MMVHHIIYSNHYGFTVAWNSQGMLSHEWAQLELSFLDQIKTQRFLLHELSIEVLFYCDHD